MIDLILFGIQGSGKGTQGKILAEKHGYKIFETGAELRNMAASGSDLGMKVKNIMNEGKLVDTSIIMEIVEDFLKKIDTKTSVIFDGIPRSQEQMSQFETLMKKMNRKPQALNIKLSREEALERLLKRFVCQGVNTSKNPLITEKECVALGGKVIRRSDDNSEAIHTRIDTFMKETQPIIEQYKELQRLIEINGNQNLEQVSQDIQKNLS
jgi:adenylate kinase